MVSAHSDAIDTAALEVELKRLAQVWAEYPEDRVLALHYSRLLALATRREPQRWREPARIAPTEVERHSQSYLAPYALEFAALRE